MKMGWGVRWLGKVKMLVNYLESVQSRTENGHVPDLCKSFCPDRILSDNQ